MIHNLLTSNEIADILNNHTVRPNFHPNQKLIFLLNCHLKLKPSWKVDSAFIYNK